MNTTGQKNQKIGLPLTMAIIPAALTVLEVAGLIFTINAGHVSNRAYALFIVQVFSVVGLFALPYFCLVFEIIGLISAIRRRKVALIVVIAIELAITIISAICAAACFNIASGI